MRHLKTGRKLNRTSSHRKALFRNLAAALFHHESIKTTSPKALELRRVADRLIGLAKSNTAHAIRRAFTYLRDKEAVKKLFSDIGTRYAEVKGGYTRVLKIGPRKGDAAPMAIIELTQKKDESEQEKERKKKPEKEVKKAPKKAQKKVEKEEKKGVKKEEKKGVKKETKAVKEKTPGQESRKKRAKQEQGD
jgi:large subunit ribosomal protein L17